MPRSRSPWLHALRASSGVLPVALLLGAAVARAQDCQPVREVRPLPEEPLPVNGYIWDVCYYVVAGDREGARSDEVCSAPQLFDAQGAAVPLEIDRRADAPPTRLVTRYRPQLPLQVGASYSLEPGDYARPAGRRTLQVVAAAEAPPAPPELLSIDYQVRGETAQARFRFAPFEGLLLKDLGGQGQPSLGALDVSRLAFDAAPELELLKEPCRENFAARPGASTLLRFGVLDLAGTFSGWGEAETVQFPTSETEFSEPGALQAAEGGEDGGCSLSGLPSTARTSGMWGPALLAILLRARRRGSPRPAR